MNNAVESQTRRPKLPARAVPVYAAGTPGRLSEWGFRLIEEAGNAFGRPFRLVDSAAAADEATFSYAPGAVFRKAAETGATILFIGDAVRDIAFVQHTAVQPQNQMLRAASAAGAMLFEAARNSRALVIRERALTAPLAVTQILGALGLPASGPVAAALIERFAGAGELPLTKAVERFPAGAAAGPAPTLDDLTAGLVKKTIAPIFQAASTGKPQTIVWPRSAFFNGDRMGEPALPWVEVAGGARILYYGPYFHIPAGLWSVSATLCFSDDLETTVFSIEVVWGTTPIARGRVRPKRAGTFYATFDVDMPPGDEPVEVRISTDQGSIFGRMALIDVTFRPTDKLTRPGAPSD